MLVDNVSLGVAPEWKDFILAIPIGMLAYTGIETVSNMAEEAKDEIHTIPAAMNHFEHRLPPSIAQAELIELVERLNADPAWMGSWFNCRCRQDRRQAKVIATIDPDKDVDGFHVANAGWLAVGGRLCPVHPARPPMMLKDQLGDLSGLRTPC